MPSPEEALARDAARQHSEQVGRGPARVDAWRQDDFVVVLLRDAFTRAERALVDAGRPGDVLRGRKALQDAMRPGLVASVEEHTGRSVVAFMSANHIEPDLAAELFLLGDDA
jgi:uncharacterized protein YbcI